MGLCWIDHFETGIVRLDCDHRAIIQVIDLMRTALEALRLDAAALQGRVLVRMVDAHFQREDRLFTTADYPRRNEHLAGHAGGRRTMEPLIEAIALGHIDAALVKLAAFETWLISEILENDLTFASYVEYFDLGDRVAEQI